MASRDYYRNWSLDERCRDEFSLDVIKTLINKEGRRKKFFYRSPQIRERPLLLSWIQKVSEQLNLQNTTFHLAVYVLDIFMDNHDIAPSKLKLLGIVCLLLAAKFEELDSNIPKISRLKKEMDSDVESTDFITMELVILKFLKWQLAIPTTAHFIEIFSGYTVQPSDLECCRANHIDVINEKIMCSMKTFKLDASGIIQELMDITVKDTSYIKFRPSVIAASIVCLARSQLMLEPQWTSPLPEITGMDETEFSLCLAWLVRESDAREENSMKIDQGYYTGGSSYSADLSPDTVKSRNP
ncbi:cyclin-J [Hetaerina americana]|uniref:cyclin-J n=1 Tax=Hetaerina americana TaxID=62018 RepID=UPI003A7F5841